MLGRWNKKQNEPKIKGYPIVNNRDYFVRELTIEVTGELEPVFRDITTFLGIHSSKNSVIIEVEPKIDNGNFLTLTVYLPRSEYKRRHLDRLAFDMHIEKSVNDLFLDVYFKDSLIRHILIGSVMNHVPG